MRSDTPKVMHPVGGRPMLGYVLDAARAAGAGRMAVVVGPRADATRRFVESNKISAAIHQQRERLGTAHAVLAARKELAGTTAKLGNDAFLSKAPGDVVDKIRERQKLAAEEVDRITARLASFG